jgi:ribonuclease BN (tRNA processing enzyme)
MIRGVDVLLHDAQFFESERSTADIYGHATVDEAIRLADEAGARALVLFHHGPNRTDVELDVVARDTVAPMQVILAREGDTIDVGAGVVVGSRSHPGQV